MQDDNFKNTVERLGNSLDVLAMVALAKEFYTSEQREALYTDYDRLVQQDRDTGEALNRADSEADKREAMMHKQATGRALNEFEKKHPVVHRLMRAPSYIGKKV